MAHVNRGVTAGLGFSTAILVYYHFSQKSHELPFLKRRNVNELESNVKARQSSKTKTEIENEKNKQREIKKEKEKRKRIKLYRIESAPLSQGFQEILAKESKKAEMEEYEELDKSVSILNSNIKSKTMKINVTDNINIKFQINRNNNNDNDSNNNNNYNDNNSDNNTEISSDSESDTDDGTQLLDSYNDLKEIGSEQEIDSDNENEKDNDNEFHSNINKIIEDANDNNIINSSNMNENENENENNNKTNITKNNINNKKIIKKQQNGRRNSILRKNNATWYAPYKKAFRKLFFPNSSDYQKNMQKYLTLTEKRYLLLILWTLHYGRRLLETIIISEYTAKERVIVPMITMAYYGSVAYMNSPGNKYKYIFKKKQRYLHKNIASFGIITFLIGEIGNGYHHYLLSEFRNEAKQLDHYVINKTRIKPHGGLFDYVSTPHYLFEIITWFGWTLLNSFSYGTVFNFFATCVATTMNANKKHLRNIKDFGNEWKNNRQALIPYLW